MRTYAAAYEDLRAACDAHVEHSGQRPRVFLANMGRPAEFFALDPAEAAAVRTAPKVQF